VAQLDGARGRRRGPVAGLARGVLDLVGGHHQLHAVGDALGGAHIRRDVPRFVAMMAAGVLDAEPLIGGRFGLDEAGAALAAAQDRELITGILLPG
jgi:Zn-dependent alcohol dehydrogenase